MKFNDRWSPGATISLYQWSSWGAGWERAFGHEGSLPQGVALDTSYTFVSIDCSPKLVDAVTQWHRRLGDGVEIGYWVDGYMCYEKLTTAEEADEMATRAVYDAQDEAYIAVTHTLSIGTSTVWLKVKRVRTRTLACARLMPIDVVSTV